jgi:hypothetical protein
MTGALEMVKEPPAVVPHRATLGGTVRGQAPGMITIERPCCDQPLAVEMPLPDALHCDECAVSWIVTDPEPALVAQTALAA